MTIGRNAANARTKNYSRRNYTGYAKPTMFGIPPPPIKEKGTVKTVAGATSFGDYNPFGNGFQCPPATRKNTQRYHEKNEIDYGEYFCSSRGGDRWYIIPLRDERPDGPCELNRLSSNGHIVVIEKRFMKRQDAEEFAKKERAVLDGETIASSKEDE